MLERFTNRAKEVMTLAAQEARRLGFQQVATPHLLLALVHEGHGVAMVALSMMNLDLRRLVRAAQEPSDVPGDTPDEDGQYTEAVRRLLRQAPLEADLLGDDQVGTEHLLLAMMRDHSCRATRILVDMGLRPEVVGTVLTSLLASASDHAPEGDLPGLSDPEEGSAHVPRLSVQLSSHASQVDALANEEAHRLNHDWVATEHLLLALLREGNGNAAQLLRQRGIDLRKARYTAEQLLPVGPRPSPSGRLPLTLGAQHVLQYAVQQARPLEQDVLYLATEHLLVGVLRESKSIAGEILRSLGVNIEEFRQEVESLIDTGAVPPEDA